MINFKHIHFIWEFNCDTLENGVENCHEFLISHIFYIFHIFHFARAAAIFAPIWLTKRVILADYVGDHSATRLYKNVTSSPLSCHVFRSQKSQALVAQRENIYKADKRSPTRKCNGEWNEKLIEFDMTLLIFFPPQCDCRCRPEGKRQSVERHNNLIFFFNFSFIPATEFSHNLLQVLFHNFCGLVEKCWTENEANRKSIWLWFTADNLFCFSRHVFFPSRSRQLRGCALENASS